MFCERQTCIEAVPHKEVITKTHAGNTHDVRLEIFKGESSTDSSGGQELYIIVKFGEQAVTCGNMS